MDIPFISKPEHYSYTYDKETDKLTRYRYGEPFIDAETQEAIQVQNVIVQYVKRTDINDNKSRIMLDVKGEGKAEFFIGGHHMTGTWSKESNKSAYIYKLDNGEDLVLKPGNTWVEFQPTSQEIVVKNGDDTVAAEGDAGVMTDVKEVTE